MNNLPEGWVAQPLAQIAHVEMGQSPDSRFYNEAGEGIPFFQGKAEFGTRYPKVRKWCTVPTKLAQPGDILLSVRAPVGPTNIANVECCVGRGLAAIRAHMPISQTYLHLFFRYIEPWLSKQGTGTTFTCVSGGFLRELEIPLAPLAEQKRIADKLDALLARVDACRDRLDSIPAILKQFRQATLAAATSGKLTEEWRKANVLSLASWKKTVFETVCREITVGYVGKMAEEYRESGIPFLRSLNVRPFRFDNQELKFISPAFHRSILKSALCPGDVVVVRTGAPGQCCVIPKELSHANCSDLVIVRPGPKLLPEFAVVFINSETSQAFVKAEQVGVAQSHFNVGSMKKTPLHLPGMAEQKEIVRRVEALFAFADRIEARYATTRAQVERLTPALLAKAFRGELVPQNPNDEPASTLLTNRHAPVPHLAPTPRHGRKPKGGHE